MKWIRKVRGQRILHRVMRHLQIEIKMFTAFGVDKLCPENKQRACAVRDSAMILIEAFKSL
jgi:hypothetical protein